MTSEAKDQSQSESGAGTAEPQPKKKPVLVAVLLIAVVLGGSVCGLVIGPRLVATLSEEDAAPEENHETEGHGESLGKFFELENLIVNPAGSRGERFLMVSVAFEVPDDESLNLLHEREIQVRDVVSATLGAHTLDALTKDGAREDLKLELAGVVEPFAGSAEWVHVYLPRFVIQ